MKTFYIGLKDKLVLIKETTTGYDFKECLFEKQPTRLAFDSLNHNRLYCSTRDINGGLSSSKITSVAVSPLRSVDGYSAVYAGTEPSMLFYSEDRGRTFQEFKGIQNVPSKKDWAFPPRPYTHFVRWITPSY